MESTEFSALQNLAGQQKQTIDELRGLLEVHEAQHLASEQTIHEVIKANINMKAGSSLLNKQIGNAHQEIARLNKIIEDMPKLDTAGYENKIKELTEENDRLNRVVLALDKHIGAIGKDFSRAPCSDDMQECSATTDDLVYDPA